MLFSARFPPYSYIWGFQKLTLSIIRASIGAEASVTLEEVTAKFEELYQGVDGQPGLKDVETLIPAKGGSPAAVGARLLAHGQRTAISGRCCSACAPALG